ncbi:unnamed protein product [Cylicostephanus goldi]|uniref:Cytochrome P450 n=1 Tax=Cylicostephanus goldi TaxID=71465 RepID=A0A3P6RQI2_CYLGO|nr:unnamed protein product [Cylicostephanus goldi]
MIYLLRNPKVMTTVREELLKVTGGSRPLSLADKQNTPYFVATLTEIQRMSSILNINIFRLADSDTEIGGHPVPKNTVVSAELSLILSDESRFPNPEKVGNDHLPIFRFFFLY